MGAADAKAGGPGSLVLVKLGGSLITDKTSPRTAREDVIRRLAEEIAEARRELSVQLIVGHGSGSFGHAAASRYDLRGTIATDEQKTGVAATQAAAADLHRIVVQALLEAGARPFSAAPSSFLMTDDGHTAACSEEPILRALDLGLTPVVYGDVVMDRTRGAAIASTEAVLQELARRVVAVGRYRLRTALWLGETGGILDGEGRTVAEVTGDNLEEVRAGLGAPRGTDVTGGMDLRLATAWELAGQGIESWIFDGRRAGALLAALLAALEGAAKGSPHGDLVGTKVPARHPSRPRRVL